MRVLFLGEGYTDIGFEREDEDRAPVAAGAVAPVLVRKILEQQWRRQTVRFEPVPRRFGWVAVGGLRRKVQTALARANSERFDAVVTLTDRDGAKNQGRLEAMKSGREVARNEDGNPLPCAIGLAIETIEAWVLDPKAARDALGLETTPDDPGAPESLGGRRGSPDHPKTVLNRWLAEVPLERFERITDAMAAIAEEVDPGELSERCPKGFAPFADEVRRELGVLR